jgi:hypothetical protein
LPDFAISVRAGMMSIASNSMMMEAVMYGPTPKEKIDICSMDPPPKIDIIVSKEFAESLMTVVLTPGAGIDDPRR